MKDYTIIDDDMKPNYSILCHTSTYLIFFQFWYTITLFKRVKSTPPLVLAIVPNMSFVPVIVLQNTIFVDAGPSKFPYYCKIQ